jgi:hypothetical protein
MITCLECLTREACPGYSHCKQCEGAGITGVVRFDTTALSRGLREEFDKFDKRIYDLEVALGLRQGVNNNEG